MTHSYFTNKARQVFTKAGGNPDLAGPLAEWAEAARDGDTSRGVLVSERGDLLAETKHTQGTVSTPGGTYVTAVLAEISQEDASSILHREVGLAAGSLRRCTGYGVIHVKHWEVCSGAGRFVEA